MLKVMIAVGVLVSVTPSLAVARHIDEHAMVGILELNCQQLYMLRNRFYHEKGLCFTRPTAVKVFGNVGCKYKSSDDLPMSANETKMMRQFIEIERVKGCPRY